MLAEAQRVSMLQAMGIDVYRLRASAESVPAPDVGIGAVEALAVCARAFGLQVSDLQQNPVVIAALAQTPAVLRDARAKRLLWQKLKPVARQVRGA